ncbi:MAG: carbohydrate kinase [Clostridiaceae bacterium]
MYDFVSIGEILIDFSPCKQEGSEYPVFQQNPGGAPANVACVLSKLGCKPAFIGKVGNDSFGNCCKNALEENGVSTEFMISSNEYNTTITFVNLDETGNREFSFYRDNTADVNLNVNDLQDMKYTDTRFFHFGSVSLSDEPSRTAVFTTVKKAKEAGCIISYDPNVRLNLWKDKELAKQVISQGIKYTDILKISEEEAEFLFEETDCEKVCEVINANYDIPIVLITKAEKGCFAMINKKYYLSLGYKQNTVDTTGAGDSFLGGILYKLITLKKDISLLSENEIFDMLNFANAIGSLVVTKKGAIPAIPTMEVILDCIRIGERNV